jgi:coxsackievirus/adenovirus receptor
VKVCGADGKTYSNRCEADCVKVDIISAGRCPYTATCADQESRYAKTCASSPVDVVCGDDGVDYKNTYCAQVR